MATALAGLTVVTSKWWFRVIESSIVLSVLFLTSYVVLDGAGYFIACVMIPTIFLTAYLEFIFNTPWPRILLPYSLANSLLLASRMLTERVNGKFELILPRDVFVWFLVLYSLCMFSLFHALTRMYSLFLKERKSRFKTIIEGVLIDISAFILFSSIIVAILIYYNKIIMIYGVLLVALEIVVPFAIPWFTRRYIVPGLLERRITFMGYTHPREPETEEFYFEIASIVAIFVMLIPALISYTRVELYARPFVSIALLGVYELIVTVFYSLAYIVCVHGAFVEELLGDRIVYIENADVFRKWRDISWFLNISLRYYLMMKYLSAMYMLLQGLEILSFRTGDKEVYFGSLHESINRGYGVIQAKPKLRRFIFQRVVENTVKELNPNDIYVIEGAVSNVENPVLREEVKKTLGSIVNIYCKLHELRDVDQSEVKNGVLKSLTRLLKLRIKIKGRDAQTLDPLINKLQTLSNKDNITADELSQMLVKQPLTNNMFRNYIVHGQLYKNALVYRDSRVKADRFFAKPGTLYTIYTLILTDVVNRHPELLP